MVSCRDLRYGYNDLAARLMKCFFCRGLSTRYRD